jgi:hypothetical protein
MRFEVLHVRVACGVLQKGPSQLPTSVVDGPYGFLVAGEEVRLVVPLVDFFHLLVGQPLRFTLTAHITF